MPIKTKRSAKKPTVRSSKVARVVAASAPDLPTVNLKYQMVDVNSLKTHPNNPRTGDLEAIKASIQATGFYGACIVQLSSSHIVAGNHRYLAARELGYAKVPVVFVDVDDAAASRILIADNRIPEKAVWDEARLSVILQNARATFGLVGTGYTESDLGDMIRRLARDKPTDEKAPELHRDAIIAAVKKYGVKRGQLWLVGRHRLLCGDSTLDTDVARVMGDLSPRLMVTDPPYGVNLDPKWRIGVGAKGTQKGARTTKVSNDDRASWLEAYQLSRCDIAYIWHSSLKCDIVRDDLNAAGFEIRQQVIWNKILAGMLSRSAYHWKHETCWYAVRKGATATWHGGRKQTTVWDVQSPISAQASGDDAKTSHPTQKPLALYERPISNHTKPGDPIYDPFVGSGTAIIAAERVNRVAIGIDIDPEFVAIAIQRCADLGLEPRLE